MLSDLFYYILVSLLLILMNIKVLLLLQEKYCEINLVVIFSQFAKCLWNKTD